MEEEYANAFNEFKFVARTALTSLYEKLEPENKGIHEFLLAIRDGIDLSNSTYDITSEDEIKKSLGDILFKGLQVTASVNFEINFRWPNLPEDKQTNICHICRKLFINGDLCRVPHCEHIFHAKCIIQYSSEIGLQDLVQCPICGRKN